MPRKTKELSKENIIKEKKSTSKKEAKKNTKTSTKLKSTKKEGSSKSKTTASKKKTNNIAKSSNTKTGFSSKKKSVNTKKTTASSKKTTPKKATVRKSAKSKKLKPVIEVLESYELPFRYNETVVKILYQTPNTLFVYWDISDKDRENLKTQYSDNFFESTKPVLIIHNKTMNYSFEIDINDFANSWYLRINDSNCHYEIELGRRPISNFKEIEKDYIYISESNELETPNDKILFNTNANNSIVYRNVKTNKNHSVSLFEIVKKIPSFQKVSNIPYISEELLKQIYISIYNEEDISNIYTLSNPSS